jgi:hypothetical protein
MQLREGLIVVVLPQEHNQSVPRHQQWLTSGDLVMRSY